LAKKGNSNLEKQQEVLEPVLKAVLRKVEA